MRSFTDCSINNTTISLCIWERQICRIDQTDSLAYAKMRCTKFTGPCHEHTSIVLCKVINPFVISHPITIVLFCSIFCSLVPIRDSCTMPSSTDVRFVKRQAFLKARCRLRQAMGWPRGAATVELEAQRRWSWPSLHIEYGSILLKKRICIFRFRSEREL